MTLSMRRYLIVVLFILLSCLPVYAGSKDVKNYDRAYINSLRGGFPDTVDAYLKDRGVTLENFKNMCVKNVGQMSPDELQFVNSLRDKQLHPTSDMLVQKVIPVSYIEKYLNGELKNVTGFFSICADTKHYLTVSDFYYGLRLDSDGEGLDYEGTLFPMDAQSIGVIRFKATNIEKSIIPRLVSDGGTFSDPLPFGGVGFTTASHGRLTSPEWFLPEIAVLEDGAEIWEVFADGSEILRGVYDTREGRFVRVSQ